LARLHGFKEHFQNEAELYFENFQKQNRSVMHVFKGVFQSIEDTITFHKYLKVARSKQFSIFRYKFVIRFQLFRYDVSHKEST
jgi:hypothetical protein